MPMFADDDSDKDESDRDKLKEDIELLELSIKDPLADELLQVTPDELPAIKPDSDDKGKKK